MQKTNIFLSALLAILAFAACQPDNIERPDDTTPAERISFVLKDSEPIVAAPDEDVTYAFKVSYAPGLASVKTSLDGEVIEGSESIWEDAPAEVDYTFSYTVKGSQFGETLDFVFTATGVDGYTYSVDYALWITANAVEFVANIPENVPAEIYSDATVEFELSIECGNVLKSIEVTKNGEAYGSKTDFTTEKTFKYPFSYTPAAEDIGTSVEFHFVVTDIKNNQTEAYYNVDVIKADAVGKMLYEEIFDTSMAISTTTAYDTAEGGITGGSATQFIASNIVKYNTLLVEDAENPGTMIENPGAMEGCTVYDNDLSALTYTSDGTDVCLSKYKDSRWTEISGTYLWYRKAKGGWFRVDGIKLHGATSLKLTYTQSTPNGKAKVEYSIDGGSTWTEIIATNTVSKMHEQKFSLAETAETISLRVSENSGTDHVRIDNIKLVEVL